MSASLVGSEMCIRDRGRVGGRAEEQQLGEVPLHALGVGQQQLEDHLHAVSYTHLTLPTICSV
eukprot:12288451-Alexandrium_andersonii.AAC.1